MKSLEKPWHYFLLTMCGIVAFVFGALLEGASDSIAENAAKKAVSELIVELPIDALTEVPVKDGRI